METSKQQDARIQRPTDLIAKELKRANSRAYLREAIAGLLVGLALRIAIGYGWDSPKPVGIPLEPGTEV